MTHDLFAALPRDGREPLAEDAVLLRDFASAEAPDLLTAVEAIATAAPFRRMMTPGGRMMSVEMTNCGPLGWVSDRAGYRYAPRDPLSGAPWPDMPAPFAGLATRAADAAGFAGFAPDACLINRYRPGAQMAPHQDRDERDLGAPIVSVSLGLPATFLFGGARRGDPARRVRLDSGDVVVWGGASRLAFHGVARLAEGDHPLTGRCRINLTFRKAG
ncbi:MAG TPA: DNA oxidative demethylase AlkB [Acetobacteraceae bacterium]|nr:DNA oxidative demethylase AlkB [Acetobacteraceae bacterium]